MVNRFKIWRTGTILPACFLNGGQDLRDFFVSTSRIWLNQGGLGIDFGAAPAYRDCLGPTDRAIRIAFGYQDSGGGWDTRNYSYVGTDANTAPPGPIVSIGYAANANLNQLDARELKRLILHELGHLLALEHEHQSPLAQCQFDWEKVVPYYKRQYGWEQEATKFNLERLAPTPGLQVTQFDPASIMNYAFPAWMFKQTGNGRTCEIKENYEPSQTDLSSYADLYPGRVPAQMPAMAAASSQGQQAQELGKMQEQQERVLAGRGARAVAALEKLLPDVGQRQRATELVGKVAEGQFPTFKIDMQGNKVTVGNITLKTDGPCSPAVAGVNGNVVINNSNCTTYNNTIGTQNNVQGNQINNQNNVQGNQFNNNGTLNNQGGINMGMPPR